MALYSAQETKRGARGKDRSGIRGHWMASVVDDARAEARAADEALRLASGRGRKRKSDQADGETAAKRAKVVKHSVPVAVSQAQQDDEHVMELLREAAVLKNLQLAAENRDAKEQEWKRAHQEWKQAHREAVQQGALPEDKDDLLADEKAEFSKWVADEVQLRRLFRQEKVALKKTPKGP